MLKLVTVLDQC